MNTPRYRALRCKNTDEITVAAYDQYVIMQVTQMMRHNMQVTCKGVPEKKMSAHSIALFLKQAVTKPIGGWPMFCPGMSALIYKHI